MKKDEGLEGRYHIKKRIGCGGNADVYLAYDNTLKQTVALKCLKNRESRGYSKKLKRFKDEIKAVREISKSIKGILPVLDHNIDKEANPHWYTMPVAMPINKYTLINSDKENIIECIRSLAETLNALHSKGIFHRDIKPSNIYFYEDNYCLGDFGLVDYPGKEALTETKESVGAKNTIAPEFKREAKRSSGDKGDVYSLAKTLWMLLTKNYTSFDGKYDSVDKKIGLGNYLKNFHLVEIEELLEQSTDNDPSKRPDMSEFARKLKSWKEISNNFIRRNMSQWNSVQKKLFKDIVPSRMEWVSINEIVKTLNIISSHESLNHMFFPDGGGMDLEEVRLASEDGCVFLFAGHTYILKPRKLIYENIENDANWGYFRLETQPLKPFDKDNADRYYEHLTEVGPGVYGPWIYGNYGYDDEGIPLPPGYQLVNRYLKGNFVIFSKASVYNKINSAYDGRHDRYPDADSFRSYIENMRHDYKMLGSDIFFEKYGKQQISAEKLRKTKARIDAMEKFSCFIDKTITNVDFTKEYKDAILFDKSKKTVMYVLYLKNRFTNPSSLGEVCYELLKDGYFAKKEYSIFDKREKRGIRFDNISQVKHFIEAFNYKVKTICAEADIEWFPDDLLFGVDMIRIAMGEHLFTKKEIETALREGNDHIKNKLVIDTEGFCHLVDWDNESLFTQYAVVHEGYQAFNNYVGKYSSLTHLDETYIRSLYGWLTHLKLDKSIYVDYEAEKPKEEQKLLEEIYELMGSQ